MLNAAGIAILSFILANNSIIPPVTENTRAVLMSTIIEEAIMLDMMKAASPSIDFP